MEQTKMRRRIALAAAAALVAVVLTGALVKGQGPNYEASKTGPTYAQEGEIITYTIDVVNTGDPVFDVSLGDEVPDFTTLESCSYTWSGFEWPCTPPDLWTLDLGAGQRRVVTKLAVKVDAGTSSFPIVNQAVLTWTDFVRVLGPVTTTVNPAFDYHVYLPVVARNVAP